MKGKGIIFFGKTLDIRQRYSFLPKRKSIASVKVLGEPRYFIVRRSFSPFQHHSVARSVAI
jgi:hypothetical protein